MQVERDFIRNRENSIKFLEKVDEIFLYLDIIGDVSGV